LQISQLVAYRLAVSSALAPVASMIAMPEAGMPLKVVNES
jgi:hypothetical protein